MALNFAICSVLSLNSWWQKSFGKLYAFWCQNEVMFSDSFASGKCKSTRKHVFLVLRLTLVVT